MYTIDMENFLSGKAIRKFLNKSNYFSILLEPTLSINGKYKGCIAGIDNAGAIRIWNPNTFECIETCKIVNEKCKKIIELPKKGCIAYIYSVGTNKDGKGIKVWDPQTGKVEELFKLSSANKYLNTECFARLPDSGSFVIQICDDSLRGKENPPITIWNFNINRRVHLHAISLRRDCHLSAISALTNEVILTGYDNGEIVYNYFKRKNVENGCLIL